MSSEQPSFLSANDGSRRPPSGSSSFGSSSGNSSENSSDNSSENSSMGFESLSEREGEGEGQGNGRDGRDGSEGSSEGGSSDDEGVVSSDNEGGCSSHLPIKKDKSLCECFCAHYKRYCEIVAPCCDKIFSCRHCHNENENHEIDRKMITEVICKVCKRRQKACNVCSHCQTVFALYHCDICNFWDEEGLTKNIFHCEFCGICRVGGRENFFHCHKCKGCYAYSSKEKHVCIEGAFENDCAICLENLFHSTKNVHVLRCGHLIHSACFTSYLKKVQTPQQLARCPICNKTHSDMEKVWRRLDRDILENPVPAELANKTENVKCVDCSKVSPNQKWHFWGIKCTHCHSYNTMII